VDSAVAKLVWSQPVLWRIRKDARPYNGGMSTCSRRKMVHIACAGADGLAIGTFILFVAASVWGCGHQTADGGARLSAAGKSSPAPVANVCIGGHWRSIAAGRYNNLAVKQDGSLWIWGWDGRGRLRDEFAPAGFAGTESQAPGTLTPVRIGLDSDWASVWSKDNSMYAIKSDGSLWGWNSKMHKGNDAPSSLPDAAGFPLPERMGSDSDWLAVVPGEDFTLAMKRDGALWGWGRNDAGELGDGTTENRPRPVPAAGAHKWRSVGANDWESFAVSSEGTLWRWGGRMREKSDPARNLKNPTQVGKDSDWQSVSFAYGHTLALKSDGSLWAWGGTMRGELGNGDTSNHEQAAPVRVGTDRDWSMVAAGVHASVAVKRDGSLWAWGDNNFGQLGDGTFKERSAPMQVGSERDWRAAFISRRHVIAEKCDGSLWTWGDDHFGQLGDGRPLSVAVPTPLAADARWTAVSAAKDGTAAIRKDGALWLWGSSLPAKEISDALGWSEVALSWSAHQGYAIRRDSSLWEVTIAARAPQRRGPDSDWSKVFADDSGAIVCKKDGSLWYPDVVWHGEKSEGIMQRIGTQSDWGTSFVHIDRSTVAAVKQNGTAWVRDRLDRDDQVRLGKEGNWKALALSSDGLLGLDRKGRLAKFDGEAWSTIGVRNDWSEVSALGDYVLALKSDGTLWSWREANPDEDNGAAEGQSTPVRVGRDSNWLHVASGGRHAAAIRTDGTLWTWGDNSEGQLGFGPETRRAKPSLLIRE